MHQVRHGRISCHRRQFREDFRRAEQEVHYVVMQTVRVHRNLQRKHVYLGQRVRLLRRGLGWTRSTAPTSKPSA
ncbi:hypothetical protein GBAR_LOCUS21526 [Geodia barretti]|uniref:Uncharacterized protein n=1 Tax=Geodia barretti TaxID=519541 RepID=A0AA35SYS8_GEOBA|nr:hypothetical protein GBAR_LOCUS21526 [Geodia barretti]